MDLRNLGIFRLISEKLNYGSERQRVLAQNIANADTPGYKSMDLVPFDFRNQLKNAFKTELATTSALHIAAPNRGNSFDLKSERKPYEASPDGNEVVLEEQMMKVAQNQLDYQTATNIYRKQIGMLKMALGRTQ